MIFVVLLVLYLLIGLAVYAVTDTTAFASRMESRLPITTFGEAQHAVFLFAVVAWPLWLWVSSRSQDPPSPRRPPGRGPR